jgi:hypothetical protein
MNITSLLQSQYLAALAMLEEVVQKCPAAIWDSPQDSNRFWRVAYHVLFYTHLYLQPNEAAFVAWAKQRGEAQFLGVLFFEGNREPVIAEPYTRAEICEYLDFCRGEVAKQLVALDYDAPSGFEWLPFKKLELQLYNIRHIQHHTGELYERLGARAGADLRWIGQVPSESVV